MSERKTELRCYPQASHPNAPLEPVQLAKRFGVSPEQVGLWIEQGLPQLAGGRIDPFICCNWLSWGPLESAPALKRLWRQFIAQFRPFVEGRDTGRSLTWNRDLALYLPEGIEKATWFIPKMHSDFSWQTHKTLQGLHTADAQITERETDWVLDCNAPQPHASMRYAVDIQPQHCLEKTDAEYSELLNIFKEVVADFDYHYRVHDLDDHPRADLKQGTCLDAALFAEKVLADKGRAARICGGVIAHSALLNAHHWLEVETTKGWVPFDVSIPAIARMLGEDWEMWSEHYCGGLDSGRIALTRGPGNWDVPEQNFVSAATGAATVHVNGQTLNAWPCIDWVCGECDGAIEKLN